MLYFLAAMKLSNYTLYRKCHFKKNLVVGRNENEKKILCLYLKKKKKKSSVKQK